MKIGDYQIGRDTKPYIVAEISGNHCGSLDKAKELIKLARWAGADAVKTQCYEADTITLDIKKADFIIQGGLWQGRSLHELYSRACTPFSWHPELYKVANDIGITIFSSVFDHSSVDLLERLGCPAYKIASFEIVDTPLIAYASSTAKPLIISTGMATDVEICEAQGAAKNGNVAFLHCTSEYPGTVENAGLIRMLDLRGLLGMDVPVGISDHTKGYIVPIAATALGGNIIEKHLKLAVNDRTSEDAEFSLNMTEFKQMVDNVTTTWKAMKQAPMPSNPSRQLRRSLYAVEDIEIGEAFSHANVRSIRPGYGLPPKELPRLIGKKARQRYKRGDRITSR